MGVRIGDVPWTTEAVDPLELGGDLSRRHGQEVGAAHRGIEHAQVADALRVAVKVAGAVGPVVLEERAERRAYELLHEVLGRVVGAQRLALALPPAGREREPPLRALGLQSQDLLVHVAQDAMDVLGAAEAEVAEAFPPGVGRHRSAAVDDDALGDLEGLGEHVAPSGADFGRQDQGGAVEGSEVDDDCLIEAVVGAGREQGAAFDLHIRVGQLTA